MKKLYSLTVLVMLMTSGCVFYDYGVKKDNANLLEIPRHYSGWERGEYQFWSIISENPHIDIHHALDDNSHKAGTIRSSIKIGGYDAKNVSVLSLSFEHRDKENNLINPIEQDWADFPVSTLEFNSRFINTYNKSEFPNEVIEIIKIKLKRGDEVEDLEYRFLLKRKLSGTFWDVMMSV